MRSKARPGWGVLGVGALLALWLGATLISHATRDPVASFSKAYDWRNAPFCSDLPAGSRARCVTRRMSGGGNLPTEGNCSVGLYGNNCSYFGGEVRFADGSTFRFRLGGGRTVHPDRAYGTVIGQFRGRRLVGLVFPETRVSLTIEDTSEAHRTASVLARLAPLGALAVLLAWSIRAELLSRAARRRRAA